MSSLNASNRVWTRSGAGTVRLPRTRSETFRFGVKVVATTALLETALVALGAAFPAAPAARSVGGDSPLRVLALAAALPLALVGLARLVETRYQTRPPKAFQAWQFSLFLLGMALVSAGFLRRQANLDPFRPLFAAGEILLGTAAVLFAAWIAAVILCTPVEDAPPSIP
jgi:hypothetical protein